MFEEKNYLLKPCPFCNGKAVISPSHRLNGSIKCTKCGCNAFSYFVPDCENWVDILIQAWNKREYINK